MYSSSVSFFQLKLKDDETHKQQKQLDEVI